MIPEKCPDCGFRYLSRTEIAGLVDETEIFTLDDVKEAFAIVRSCQSVPILVKAIAAAIARTREESAKLRSDR